MIEIIAGVIVLILAIIGIAKLASGRGSRGSLNPDEVVQTVSAWKRALLKGLYGDPESLRTALKYAGPTASASKSTISALYKNAQLTREKVDAAVQRRIAPMQDAADYLDDVPPIASTMSQAYNLLRAGKIDPEQFRSYVLSEIRDQNNINKRHYMLRHTGMD